MVVHVQSTHRFAVLAATISSLYPSVQLHERTKRQTADIKHKYDTNSTDNWNDKDVTTFINPKDVEQINIPILSLEDLLLHKHRQKTDEVQQILLSALEEFGFIILTTSSTSRPAKIIQNMRNSIHSKFFPDPSRNGTKRKSNANVADLASASINGSCNASRSMGSKMYNEANLKTSDIVYVSEKGVPMYKLGYELCEDRVREIFRIPAGYPDLCEIWPENNKTSHYDTNNDVSAVVRSIWIQGIGLMRNITDNALDLLIASNPSMETQRKRRLYSGNRCWLQEPPIYPLQERPGDFSMLYAMHYFNDYEDHCESSPNAQQVSEGLATKLPEPGIAVKAHLDPSLFVCEPYLCKNTKGLQVADRKKDFAWLDCDGPESPLVQYLLNSDSEDQREAMLLFVGKAIQSIVPTLQPTLHRVVTGRCSRKTVIYEQKYEEFFPPPILD